jgi:hypothetical protein
MLTQKTTQLEHEGDLTQKDLVLGTIIAILMATIFILLSSGKSLIVTFVPGVVISWLIFVRLYQREVKLPETSRLMPLYFIALSVQFLHFAEEFTHDFASRFPALYQGPAYSINTFLAINMISYAIFTLAFLLVFIKGKRFLLLPVLFFIVYGVMGNAIAHTVWSIYLQGYFPGFFTAQLYWFFGPLLLYNLTGDRKETIKSLLLFAVVLIPLLIIFISV